MDTHDARRAAVEAQETKAAVFEARLREAERLRGEGNALFKEGDAEGALMTYERAFFHCDFDPLSFEYELLDEHRAAVRAVLVPVLLNLAAALLLPGPLHHPTQAAEHCSAALEHDEGCVKALFRRGQARRALGDLDRARGDLLRAVELAPADRKVRAALAELQEDRRLEREKSKKKDKELFGGWATTPAASLESAGAAAAAAASPSSDPSSDPASSGTPALWTTFWGLAAAVGLVLLIRAFL